MIIPKKTAIETDLTWSVILNPVKGELARSQAIDKITRFFSLTHEEARELIANAPVLLLEDLPFESAQKIKYHFSGSGLDIAISNNSLQKRKCFRTVWNGEPRFNFESETTALPTDMPGAESVKEALNTDQAISHIREEIKTDGNGSDSDARKKYDQVLRRYNLLVEDKSIQDKKMEALEDEIRFLREKEHNLQTELRGSGQERENLTHEMEALRIKNTLMGQQQEMSGVSQERLISLEEENQALVQRYDALRREYDEAEKIWVKKYAELEERCSVIAKDLEDARKMTGELRSSLQKQASEHSRAVADEILSIRESALRELVKRQDELSREISEKEKLLKNILSEQEKMEKEIVRAKQAKNAV